MKHSYITILLVSFFIGASPLVYARDFGVLVLPIHEGKLTSSILYENIKQNDSFDTRGRADFRANVAGAQFSYGVTDQIAVAVKAGALIDPQESAQGAEYESRSGYLYGIDLYNEVFPATDWTRPGLQISGGVTGFQIPFDRRITAGSVDLIDQKMSGYEYHGAVLATIKASIFELYFGVRGFGSSLTWRDNSPSPGGDASISGHAHGNISLVVGVPAQVTKDVRFQVEGAFINETLITAGFTIATF